MQSARLRKGGPIILIQRLPKDLPDGCKKIARKGLISPRTYLERPANFRLSEFVVASRLFARGGVEAVYLYSGALRLLLVLLPHERGEEFMSSTFTYS